ncbi:hypothetical protein MBLNU230_g1557t1 [Neophaeotheca triangularis]
MATHVVKEQSNAHILPLPPDAIAQIHSSKNITNLQGVVLALLENCLDAQASKVHINVDFRKGGCSVEDNGEGMKPVEFTEFGGLGKLYHTSKRSPNGKAEIHGRTGTYLASLAALSLLSVTSQHGDGDQQATISMHQGKVISRHVPSTTGSELARFATHGTAVTVHDLFGNIPVRVKQRTLTTEVGSEDERAWMELKRGIVALLLAWPKPCAVRIQDSSNDNKDLKLAAYHPHVANALTEKSLNQLAGKSAKFDLRDALPLLTQAGLMSVDSRNRWVPVSASTLQISVRGSICLDGSPTKQCQFISVGVRPCLPSSGHNELYEVVNKIFHNSSFGTVADEEVDETEKDRRKSDRRYKADGFTRQQLQGRKSVDRHPMFVLQVKFKEIAALQPVNDSVSDRQLKGLIEVLEATTTEWLTAHHFRPQKRSRRKNDLQTAPSASTSNSSASNSRAQSPVVRKSLTLPSLKRTPSHSSTPVPAKRRQLTSTPQRPSTTGAAESSMARNQSTYFTSWSRIKSGRDSFYNDIWENEKPATAPSRQAESMGDHRGPESVTSIRVPSVASTRPQRTNSLRVHASKAELARDLVSPQKGQEHASDDFGSVDEGGLLGIAQQLEWPEIADAQDALPLPDVESEHWHENIQDETVTTWVDPITKQEYRVNNRTGVVLPLLKVGSSTDAGKRRPAAIDDRLSASRIALSKSHQAPSRPPVDTGVWLPGFLKDWKNPVFSRQNEESIPVAAFEGSGSTLEEATAQRCKHLSIDQQFQHIGAVGMSQLSKKGLKHAQVIAQVDRKFILCKMPALNSSAETPDNSTVVLVDQHAASERVILETLFAELCTPPSPSAPSSTFTSNTGAKSSITTTLLIKPPSFQLSPQDHTLCTTHAPHFANWGILYDLHTSALKPLTPQFRASPREPCEHRLTVRALPPAISERCTAHPRLLIDLLRSEIWTLADTTAPKTKNRSIAPNNASSTQASPELAPNWLHALPSCPKGVIDLLNSRACRSAVMFNDVLTVGECAALLERLAGCVFPFVCAHGRVGMVPVVGLEGEGVREGEVGSGFARLEAFGSGVGRGKGEGEGQNEVGEFGRAWRRWTAGRARGV